MSGWRRERGQRRIQIMDRAGGYAICINTIDAQKVDRPNSAMFFFTCRSAASTLLLFDAETHQILAALPLSFRSRERRRRFAAPLCSPGAYLGPPVAALAA
ncbi:MAG TPA: hypothetical protein VK540_34610 [Polyangiaceae bacterium]|nr:hypothetical protein [Polyangiaceae bacterium]